LRSQIIGSFIVKVVAVGVGFLSTFAIAKLYSPDKAGLMFYLLNLILLGGTICCTGVEQSILRHAGFFFKDLAAKKRVIALVLMRVTLCSLIFTAIFFEFAISENIDAYIGFLFIFLSIIVFSLYIILIESVKGLGAYLFYISFQGGVTGVIFLTCSFFFETSLDAFILMYAVVMFLLVVLLLTVKLNFTEGNGNNMGEPKLVLHDANRVWGASILQAAISFSIPSIIMLYHNASDVAVFVFFQKVAMVVSFSATVVNGYFTQRIVNLINDHRLTEVLDLSRKIFIFSLVMSLAISLSIYTVIYFYLPGNMDPAYQDQKYLFVLLLIWQSIYCSTSIFSLILVLNRNGKNHTKNLIISTMSFFLIIYFFGEKSKESFAFALIIASAVQGAAAVYTSRSKLRITNVY
jgi:O-antigen/teichoic acid export membrane protein